MRNFSIGILVVRFIAEGEAKAGSFDAIYPEHLWMALTKISDLPNDALTGLLEAGQPEKTALLAETEALRKWFAAQNIDTIRLRRKLRSLLGKGNGAVERLHRAPASVALFEAAAQFAAAGNENMVNLLHLNQAMLTNPPAKLAEVLIEAGHLTPQFQESNQVVAQGPVAPAQVQNPQSILAVLGRDLTALAQQGALEPLIGRREELRRLAQILIQKRKRNALLVGESGVGKTCLVEGLAQRIVAPECAPALRGKRIIELSMATLLAGAFLRGEFETRIEAVIREADADPRIILFIDEFHTIMAPSSGLDAANMLKPALTRGQINLIGAATTQEYERYLVRDDAIARRFEVLWVAEPSRADALEILTGAKSGLEEHHGVHITPDAIAAAVTLAIRYLPDRRLPDKALDLLDQACTQKALQSVSIRPKGTGKPPEFTEKIKLLKVGREEIAQVIAKRCRVPYELLAITDQERLQILEPFLAQRIIGQATALRQISAALQAAYKGLKDSRRPIASFLFVGPTGVGKTETARVLSEFLFGSPENLIRIDLSEYMERHQVARLLGAPPGYVGYEEAGLLTSALRQRPAAVVLFDEVDKAHPDVLNVLLQILDEGQLTDSQGRKASFRETVVILTSNAFEAANPIGFNVAGEKPAPPALGTALQHYLRPELIGRIEHLILFEPLSRDALLTIAEKLMQQFRQQLQEQQQDADFPEELRQQIMAKISSLQFGARELEQVVKAEITAWLIRWHENNGHSLAATP